MIVNSKIKHKCKTMLGVIRNVVLDFTLYFLIAYMKVPYTCNNSTGCNTKYTMYYLKR